MTWQIRLKAMTRYELTRFAKALPLNIILVLIFLPLFGFVISPFSFFQKLGYLFQELAAEQYPPYYGEYYLAQLRSAYNVLGALPDPLRGYVAFLLLFKSDIVSIAFNFQFMLAMLISSIAIFAMIRTSRIKNDEVYLFVRVDRGKLLVFRSIMSALLYSLFATLLTYFLRLYAYNSLALFPLSSLIDWLAPLHAIILPLFFFLLFAQAIIALINIYFPRMTFFVPFFLLFSYIIFVLPFAMGGSPLEITSMRAIYLVTLLSFSRSDTLATYVQQMLLNELLQLLIVRGELSRMYILPFSHLLTLIHLFSSLAGGVWNIMSFDPAWLPMEAFIGLPVSLLVQGGEPLTQTFAVFSLIKFFRGLPYNPALSFAYLACLAVALLYLAARVFKRKTI